MSLPSEFLAMMVPVKILICEGLIFSLCETKGADARVFLIRSISGLNFVATDFKRTGSPTVASLSLGGGISNAVDNAIVQVSLMI
jgi:hypothetical protein